jgi:twinkle protein
MTIVAKRTTCPKCSATRRNNPSEKCLAVFDNGNSFCHHCNTHSYKDGKKNIKTSPAKNYKRPANNLPKSDMPKQVIDYFSKRKITMEVLKRNKVSWNGKEILFPYFYDGELLNIKYKTLDKQFRQEKDAEPSFYGMDDIYGEKDIFVVEGEEDRLACEVAGFTNAVSVPAGAPSIDAKTYSTKFEFIDNWQHLFVNIERIIIAVDSDAPGGKLEAELIRRFGYERCMRIRWPDNCKDANQTLVEHGIVGLMECLERPRHLPVEGVFSANDFHDAYVLLYEEGVKGGLKTGWDNVDEFYTVRAGELCIVTGIPSNGKSSWLTALNVNLTEQFEWKFGIYSPENQPMQRYMASIAAIHVGKPFKKGHTERMTLQEALEAEAWMNEHFYFIQPKEKVPSVDDLIKSAKDMVRMYGINGLVLDPWNIIEHARPSGMTETDYISKSLTKFGAFAKSYDVKVWIVVHPNKLQKNARGGFDCPTAYDLAGSAHWYNKADDIVAVHRDLDDESKEVEIHIQKVRFREVGKRGIAGLKFDVITGKYRRKGDMEKYSNI